MGDTCIIDSILRKRGLFGEQNVANHMLELIQRQNSNRLPKPAGLRCWMRWLWYGYIPSVCNVRQNLVRGTIRVIMRGFRCAISIIFSSFSTFRRTWLSAWRFALGNEPFSLRLWCTQVNTRLSGIRRLGYRCRYPSTVAARYKMCVGIIFIYKRHVYSNVSLHTGARGDAVVWGTALQAGM